jgi:glycosyltransferase involved in cell wall biosynthesis
MFARVIRQRRPDVVHFQEFAGHPWSLIDVADRMGVANVVTLQDYYAVCPTFKLLDHQGKVCLRREIGADCVATTAAEERDANILFEATLGNSLARLRMLQPLPEKRRVALVRRLAHGITTATVRPHEAVQTPEAFQRRRDVNVARLGRADRVIAMSERVAEIHALLGVDPERLATMQLTLRVIDGLTPRERPPEGPLTFATLGALESRAKGARVLLDAVRRLGEAVPEGSFRLLVFGFVDPAFRREAAALPGVTLRGPYPPDQLDALLDEVDVGLMPSVWEEAYGYAGVEFLAKGIPVISNAIGGMPEYTREGRTGWLNRSCSAEELTRIMRELVEAPEQAAELRESVIAARGEIVKPHATHVEEMQELYDAVIAERAARRRAA